MADISSVEISVFFSGISRGRWMKTVWLLLAEKPICLEKKGGTTRIIVPDLVIDQIRDVFFLLGNSF